MAMYLRAAKTEAEAAGEETEGMAGSVSELREELLKLTNGKVDIQLDEDTFKSTYQILKELSAEWDNLTDITQANILEMIAGKRNANAVSAMLEGFDEAEKVMKTASESAGSALQENEKYLDSVAGKLAQLQTSVEVLYTSVMDSELLKFGISFLDVLTQILTVISDTAFDNFFSTLATFGAVGGGVAFFKNLD